MKKHWRYLSYLIRHKWFVYLACRKCGVSLWRSIIHDWHKFLPDEWLAYANHFYGKHFKWSDIHGDVRNILCYKDSQEYWRERFDQSWNLHQKRARHHWQFWLLTNDSSEPKHQPLIMPEKYLREMVADWWGAGRAITGKWEAHRWYEANQGRILISDSTRILVEQILSESSQIMETPENLAKRQRILGY